MSTYSVTYVTVIVVDWCCVGDGVGDGSFKMQIVIPWSLGALGDGSFKINILS